jgi:hypothetical protein
MRKKNHTKNQIHLGKSNVNRQIHYDGKSQMIVLMGIILSISVFVISSLSADIANLDAVVPSERFISLIPEFTNIKESFGRALNYNLVDNVFLESNQIVLMGNITDIYRAFSQTKDEFRDLEMQHDILFDATLNGYWCAHPLSSDYVYHVNVSLSIDDRNTHLSQDVLYSIVCKPYAP